MQNDTDPATMHKHDVDGPSAYMFPERVNTHMETKKENFLRELGSALYFETQGIKKKGLRLFTQLTGDCCSLG